MKIYNALWASALIVISSLLAVLLVANVVVFSLLPSDAPQIAEMLAHGTLLVNREVTNPTTGDRRYL